MTAILIALGIALAVVVAGGAVASFLIQRHRDWKERRAAIARLKLRGFVRVPGKPGHWVRQPAGLDISEALKR